MSSKELLLNSKTWGKSLIYHRKMMNAEYKKSLKRLSFLAEERHIQYREDYIDNVKERIEKNKQVVAQQAKAIRDLSNTSAKKKTLIDMGWESIKKQMSEEKQIRQTNNKIIFEKTKSLQDKARREWLIEMNDKCTTWNKSPEELKYSKYRILNKKILERIPRDKNYVIDQNEQPEDGAAYEISAKDGYTGPLRSNSQQLAFILANNGKLPLNKLVSQQAGEEGTEQSLSIDPSSPEYQEYLEFLKYNKEREKKKQQKLVKLQRDNIAAYHSALNSENVLANNTSGVDLDLLTTSEESGYTDLTLPSEYDEDDSTIATEDLESDEYEDTEDVDDEDGIDEDEDVDNDDFSFLDKKN